MPIRLRFAIHGVRNNRVLHLVAIDQRKRRNARPLELLGKYYPRVEQNTQQPVKRMEWALDRLRFWLDHGALPSEAVARLLRVAGVQKRTEAQIQEHKAFMAQEKERLEQERSARVEAERDQRRLARETAAIAAQTVQPEIQPRRFERPQRDYERRERPDFSADFMNATVDPVSLREQNAQAALDQEDEDGEEDDEEYDDEDDEEEEEEDGDEDEDEDEDGDGDGEEEEDWDLTKEEPQDDQEGIENFTGHEEEFEGDEEFNDDEEFDDDDEFDDDEHNQDQLVEDEDVEFANMESSYDVDAQLPTSASGETAVPFTDDRRANPRGRSRNS